MLQTIAPAARPPSATMPRSFRRVLLLQGPVGPFFRDLQNGLIARGHFAIRATFNAGDRLHVGSGPHIRFDGPAETLADWLTAIIEANRIDTIVLFGDERPIHRTARALAAARGIAVLCLEEGYLRPGYVTAEWGGCNHNSPLIGSYDAARAAAIAARAPAPAPVVGGFGPIIRNTIAHHVMRNLLATRNERTLFHRRRPLVREAGRWILNYAVKLATGAADRRLLARLRGELFGRYDLVALQVPDDASLLVGGGTWTTKRLIEESIASLAFHAPGNRHLVFKLHPLARGHSADAAMIRRRAAAIGVADRVHVLHSGPLADSLRGARGLITITSTSSFSSLRRGKPTLVLGRSMTEGSDLCIRPDPADAFPAAFWTAQARRDPAGARIFIDWMRALALLPGDFYHGSGRAIAVRSCVEKIAAGQAEMLQHPARAA